MVRQAKKDVSAGKKLGEPVSESAVLHNPSDFDPKQTFDLFVVGDGNHFAYAAAMAVAQAPGKAYNPLLVHGGVGLGKTHLLPAVGRHVLAQRTGARVAFVSAESFINEFLLAIQNSQLARFRTKYRQADVLLIDDIQFLAGADQIQEEFFHTFNALHVGQKQIVLTCDRPASEVKNLELRLVSRFEGGLVTKLQPPDGETRLAILRKKARYMRVELPEEILAFLANRIRTNIRRLEGALIRLAAFTVLVGKKPSLQAVEDLLRELLDGEARPAVDIQLIQRTVAEHFGIRLADMTSHGRSANITFPRQVAMYLSRQMTTCSLNDIGDAFSGRYHGTVLHASRLLKDRMDVDPDVRQVVGHLERQLLR